MKTTLLLAMLSTTLTMPQASAATELETLRARCAAQEEKIRNLEAQLQKLSGQPAPAKPAPAAAPAAAPAPSYYIVRPGDWIEKIARKVKCSPTALAKANGLKLSSVIHPGQKLKLPGSASAPAATASASASQPASSATTHTIRPGDTYSGIALKYRTTVAALTAANPGVKATALRPGQVIRLSQQTSAQASAPAPAPQPKPQPAPAPSQLSSTRPAPAPAPVPPPAPSSAPVPAPSTPANTAAAPPKESTPTAGATPPAEKKIRSVTIDGEMTYAEFAAKHGTDTARLNDLNGLDLTNGTVLAKGSELYVPVQP